MLSPCALAEKQGAADGRPYLPSPSHPATAAILPKACADGNAAALDKALEALAALLPKASDAAAGRMVGTASGNIVAKCLGARPGTAAKGTECLKLFVEAECGERVVVGGIGGRGAAVCEGTGPRRQQRKRGFAP
jgi:hypothetical protein